MRGATASSGGVHSAIWVMIMVGCCAGALKAAARDKAARITFFMCRIYCFLCSRSCYISGARASLRDNLNYMLRNYLKTALRNLWRNKGFSAINILGLTIGMASSLLILLWVRNELSYDRFHAQADRIYRITVDASGFKAAVNPAGMPAGLQAAMPEIRSVLRVAHERSILFSVGTREFEEPAVLFADSNFLQFFSYALKKGDVKTAMKRTDGLLLTEAMARKYFGTDAAIGKTLKMNN